MKELLSVVIPVYGCAACLAPLAAGVARAAKAIGLPYELILVDDGDPGGSWDQIRALCAKDRRIKGLRLSRNFGQHYAISAGLDQARGSHIVIMDCDLQDDPAEIPKLYRALSPAHDAILGRRAQRKDPWVKRALSWAFYKVLGFLTDSRLDSQIANFGIYRSKLIEAVRSMGDQARFFPVMVQWVGFQVASIEVAHADRHSGRSAYTLGRLIRLAVNTALTFSDRPLRIIVNLGFCISALAGAYALYILNLALRHGISVPGWTSVIISVWFLCGMQMMMGGIVGIYVGKIFDASKRRPLYVLRSTLNLER